MHRPVVRMLPTYTVNITGLRSWCRGSSLRNDSKIARRTIGGSNRDGLCWSWTLTSIAASASCAMVTAGGISSSWRSGSHSNIFNCSTTGPRARAGNERQRADQSPPCRPGTTTNSGVCVGSVPALVGVCFFRTSEPAMAKRRNRQPIAGEQHRDGQRRVVERHVGVDAGERAAVVVAGRGKGISTSEKPWARGC